MEKRKDAFYEAAWATSAANNAAFERAWTAAELARLQDLELEQATRDAEATYNLKASAENCQAHIDAAIEAQTWASNLYWGVEGPAPATKGIVIDLVTEPTGPGYVNDPDAGDVNVPDAAAADPLLAGMVAADAADPAPDGTAHKDDATRYGRNEFERASKTLPRCCRIRHCGWQCKNQSSSKCTTGLCRNHCLKQKLECSHCGRDGGQNDRGPRSDRTRHPGPHHHHHRRLHKWR